MKEENVTKKRMAERLRTSRAQVDRLLDPEYVGISLSAVTRAAHVLGKRLDLRITSQLPRAKVLARRRRAG